MNLNDLLSKLNQAKPFLMNQEFIPILTHFCFDKDSLTAYNDVAGIKLQMSSDIHGAVPGSMAVKMLSTLKDETVRVSMKGSKFVHVDTGTTNFDLPLLPPEEFIFEIPDTEGSTLIQLPLSFLKGLEKTLISIGDDPLHPERSGVTWQISSDKITLYSTDSKSISMYEWESDKPLTKGTIEVITPKFFCEQLISIAKNYAEELEHVDLYFNTKESFVIADLDKICEIFTRLIQSDTNTDYDLVISNMLPADDEIQFFGIPLGLESALDRALVINSLNTLDGKKSYVQVLGDTINIRTENIMGGRSSDDIKFPASIGEFEFYLDPELLERSFKYTSQISICENLMVLTDGEKFTHLVSYS